MRTSHSDSLSLSLSLSLSFFLSHTHTHAIPTHTHTYYRTISVCIFDYLLSKQNLFACTLSFFLYFFLLSFRCETCQIVALLLRVVSDSLTLLTVILLAKGWTVVRRKISAKGRVKIAIFMTSCVLSYMFLLIDFWIISLFFLSQNILYSFLFLFFPGTYSPVCTVSAHNFQTAKTYCFGHQPIA